MTLNYEQLLTLLEDPKNMRRLLMVKRPPAHYDETLKQSNGYRFTHYVSATELAMKEAIVDALHEHCKVLPNNSGFFHFLWKNKGLILSANKGRDFFIQYCLLNKDFFLTFEPLSTAFKEHRVFNMEALTWWMELFNSISQNEMNALGLKEYYEALERPTSSLTALEAQVNIIGTLISILNRKEKHKSYFYDFLEHYIETMYLEPKMGRYIALRNKAEPNYAQKLKNHFSYLKVFNPGSTLTEDDLHFIQSNKNIFSLLKNIGEEDENIKRIKKETVLSYIQKNLIQDVAYLIEETKEEDLFI